MSREDYVREQEQLLEPYRAEWKNALLYDGQTDLRASLLREVAAYYHVSDSADIDRSCDSAVDTLKSEWEKTVDSRQRASIESFYETKTHIRSDKLAYAERRQRPLGLRCGLADRARPQREQLPRLRFRCGIRRTVILPRRYRHDACGHFHYASRFRTLALWSTAASSALVDLKDTPLPQSSFDMIMAMDVFEHLVDPVEVVQQLWRAMKPGGLFFARIHAAVDPSHPQHIVEDFDPTFARMEQLGFMEKWRDRALWGHVLFQKCD